jgi:hypothetical protein
MIVLKIITIIISSLFGCYVGQKMIERCYLLDVLPVVKVLNWENGKDYKVDQLIGEKKKQLVFMEFCSSSEISMQLICAVDKWGIKYKLSHMPMYIDKNVKCVFACDVENMPLKIYGARCERKVVYKINGMADEKYIFPQIKYFDRFEIYKDVQSDKD